MKKLILALSFLSLASCASKPVLYPNAKYNSVGEARAQKDIKDCEDKAEVYVKNEQAKNTAKGAGRGAAMGAVIGGILGGNLRSVGRGAVGGGMVGAAGGAMSPKRLTQRFVSRCLAEKGYEVIGYE